MKNSSKNSKKPTKYKSLSTKSFEKNFRKLSLELKRRMDRKIRWLSDNPYAGKSLHGELKGKYSLRIGDYRIVYTITKKIKL
jgi:mRNA interferase RelE/StbE